jgi:hypothetical protein
MVSEAQHRWNDGVTTNSMATNFTNTSNYNLQEDFGGGCGGGGGGDTFSRGRDLSRRNDQHYHQQGPESQRDPQHHHQQTSYRQEAIAPEVHGRETMESNDNQNLEYCREDTYRVANSSAPQDRSISNPASCWPQDIHFSHQPSRSVVKGREEKLGFRFDRSQKTGQTKLYWSPRRHLDG